MWDLSRSGTTPVLPALADRFFTTKPPGKPSPPHFIDEKTEAPSSLRFVKPVEWVEGVKAWGCGNVVSHLLYLPAPVLSERLIPPEPLFPDWCGTYPHSTWVGLRRVFLTWLWTPRWKDRVSHHCSPGVQHTPEPAVSTCSPEPKAASSYAAGSAALPIALVQDVHFLSAHSESQSSHKSNAELFSKSHRPNRDDSGCDMEFRERGLTHASGIYQLGVI